MTENKKGRRQREREREKKRKFNVFQEVVKRIRAEATDKRRGITGRGQMRSRDSKRGKGRKTREEDEDLNTKKGK